MFNFISILIHALELRDERALRDNKFQQLIYLWEQLPSFEKKKANFPRSYTKKQWSGKFRRRRKHVAPGVESITKLSSPRTQPKSSAVAKLQQIHRGRMAFHNIRQVVVKSQKAMQRTEIQLPLLNKKQQHYSSGKYNNEVKEQEQMNLLQGIIMYNKEEKEQEHKILLQGKDMPKPPMTASGLPEARQKPVVLPSSEAPMFTFQKPSIMPALENHNTQMSCHNGAAAIVHPSWSTLKPSNITSINNSNNKNTFKKRPRSYKIPEYIKCSKCGQNRKKI
ncbi:hypothetical protein MAR_004725 [Mya arenaria]|uniref:Uncharacterized protein n=1 Tax=Mya arenaria TaxID=6604 RepID=A0ABY7EZ07_MYAAR|nr:hypothetical protein MAR_004725 [Mya arenaria]